MNRVTDVTLLSFLILAVCSSRAYAAPDTQETAKDAAVAAATWDGASPPGIAGTKVQPLTPDTAGDTIGEVVTAAKAKRWWFVAGGAVFLIMLLLNVIGVLEKIGKGWSYTLTGVLTLIASILLTFDEKGFSWATFMAYMTAGPTIAWLRGFGKKAAGPLLAWVASKFKKKG